MLGVGLGGRGSNHLLGKPQGYMNYSVPPPHFTHLHSLRRPATVAYSSWRGALSTDKGPWPSTLGPVTEAPTAQRHGRQREPLLGRPVPTKNIHQQRLKDPSSLIPVRYPRFRSYLRSLSTSLGIQGGTEPQVRYNGSRVAGTVSCLSVEHITVPEVRYDWIPRKQNSCG